MAEQNDDMEETGQVSTPLSRTYSEEEDPAKLAGEIQAAPNQTNAGATAEPLDVSAAGALTDEGAASASLATAAAAGAAAEEAFSPLSAFSAAAAAAAAGASRPVLLQRVRRCLHLLATFLHVSLRSRRCPPLFFFFFFFVLEQKGTRGELCLPLMLFLLS